MTVQPSDVYDLLMKIRYDATAIQAKVTDALNALRELELPDRPVARCEVCGLSCRGPNTLAEHVYTSHGGPLPAHWETVDAKIAREKAADG